jgi:23S rRNA (adenine2030-N6)-methyltransferase
VNYQHAFHAGNFADVYKHAVLVGLLDALCAKPGALCYFETHAAAGRYSFASRAVQHSAESAQGVLALRGRPAQSAWLKRYLERIDEVNGGTRWHDYPGSPCLAARVLRPEDRLLLCELNGAEARKLKAHLAGDGRVRVFVEDGYAKLIASVPPKGYRRGLILIDSPYEAQQDEFDRIGEVLTAALERWPVACYAVWYPIKLREHVQAWHRRLGELRAKRILVGELLLYPDNTALRLNGCGMALINPPHRFEIGLEELGAELADRLATGRYRAARVFELPVAGPARSSPHARPKSSRRSHTAP